MNWFNSHKTVLEATARPRLASRSDMEAIFETEHENLFWIAYLITGDAYISLQTITQASELSFAISVFQDWLVRWAHSITARVAIDTVRAPIAQLANCYADWGCNHRAHDVFSNEESEAFRLADPIEVLATLNPFARSVAVLRGMEKASASECALRLGVSRHSITGAYCEALQWTRQRRSFGIITLPVAIAQSVRRQNETGVGEGSGWM